MQKQWTREGTRHGCGSRLHSLCVECRRPIRISQGDVSFHAGSRAQSRFILAGPSTSTNTKHVRAASAPYMYLR
jgi:hypothetical protein